MKESSTSNDSPVSPGGKEPTPSTLQGLIEIAHTAVKKIRNQELLGGIALFTIGAALSLVYLFDKDLTLASPWVVVVGISYLIAPLLFYIIIDSLRKRRFKLPDKLTIGAFRRRLEELTETELTLLRQEMDLPEFPPEATTVKKRVQFIVEFTPVKPQKSSYFSLAAAVCVSALGIGLVLLFPLENRRIPAQEQVIRSFYENLNRGIGGEAQGWTNAWNMLSKSKKAATALKYHGNYPGHFGELYAASGHHQLESVRFIETTSDGPRYQVIYTCVEPLARGEIFAIFDDPQNETTTEEFYKRFPDVKSLIAAIAADFERLIPLPQGSETELATTREKIKSYLWKRTMEQLRNPNLFSEIAAYSGVKPDSESPQLRGKFREYEIHFLVDIFLNNDEGPWRIVKLVHQAQLYVPSRRLQQ